MPIVQPAELWQETGRWDKYRPGAAARSRTGTSASSATADRRGSHHRLRAQRASRATSSCRSTSTRSRPSSATRSGRASASCAAREFMMKDAYSFHTRRGRAASAVREDVRRLRAHLHAPGAAVPRRSRPTPARSAAPARTNSRCSPIPARTRSRSRPASDYAANVELAEALAPAARARRAAAAAARCRRRPGKPRARTSPRCSASARAHGQVAVLRDVRQASGEASCIARSAAAARRPRAQRGQGRRSSPGSADFRFATEQRSSHASVASPAISARSAPRRRSRVVADRTVAAMGDFVVRRQRADFHYTGVNWGRDLPEPALSPTCATSSPATRRPTARARWQIAAASRSATCSSSAPRTRSA